METVNMSAQSQTAARRLEQLCDERKLFDENFDVKHTDEVEKASNSLMENLGHDLATRLKDSHNGHTDGKILWAGLPNKDRHVKPHLSMFCKVEVGNGYCAY